MVSENISFPLWSVFSCSSQMLITQRIVCACVIGVCGDQDSHLALFQQDIALMETAKRVLFLFNYYFIDRDHSSYKCKMIELNRLEDNEEKAKLNKKIILVVCLEKRQSCGLVFIYEIFIKCS